MVRNGRSRLCFVTAIRAAATLTRTTSGRTALLTLTLHFADLAGTFRAGSHSKVSVACCASLWRSRMAAARSRDVKRPLANTPFCSWLCPCMHTIMFEGWHSRETFELVVCPSSAACCHRCLPHSSPRCPCRRSRSPSSSPWPQSPALFCTTRKHRTSQQEEQRCPKPPSSSAFLMCTHLQHVSSLPCCVRCK